MELTTVPSFVFYQGDGIEPERPIEVKYYNTGDLISLEQSYDGGKTYNSINLDMEHAKELFKLIIKHQSEAAKALAR